MTIRNTLLSLSVFSVAAVLLSGCQAKNEAKQMTKKAVEKVADKTPALKSSNKKITWTHASGVHGPENWGGLSDKFSTCDSGRLQSPFNITADITADLPDLALNYSPVPMHIVNNSHTIQAELPGSGQFTVDGKSYDLLQFHFHAHSEYAIDGKKYPLEAHLVHTSKSGELAVIGVMFEEGAANAELAKIWANMPTSKGENKVSGETVNVNNLLPENREHYRFMGSLTTPPCSEGVNWFVMKQPLTASAAQIKQYAAIYPMNARPLQDENNRLVVIGK